MKVVACAALLLAVVACAGGNGQRPATSPMLHPTAAVTATSTVPAAARAHRHRHHAFSPQSFTAISNQDWWVLGTRACHAGRCEAIAHTTDGGQHFLTKRVPKRAVAHKGTTTQLRFADAQDGYLFGRLLYVTHDAGRSWHRAHVRHNVRIVASAGLAYAEVGGYRHTRLLRSKASSDDWTRLPTPRRYRLGALWVQGSDIFVYGQRRNGDNSGRLLESTDAGQSWTMRHLPIEDLSCATDVVHLPVIWEQCATGMMAGVWRSTDGGRSYRQPDEGQPAMPNSAAFAAASNRTAVVGYQKLQRTSDGGKHWHTVGPRLGRFTSWDYLGFTDPKHGAGLTLTNAHTPTQFTLWATSDGGRHWRRIHINS